MECIRACARRVRRGGWWQEEIDRRVRGSLSMGHSLYGLDEGRLKAADPTVVLTQGEDQARTNPKGKTSPTERVRDRKHTQVTTLLPCDVHCRCVCARLFLLPRYILVPNYYGGPKLIGPMVHMKTYIFNHFYQHYLVLFTMVLRNR